MRSLLLYRGEISMRFPCFYDTPPARGSSKPSPGAPFHAPRSPSRTAAPDLSPKTPRVAVWGGVARSRGRGESGGARESRCFAGHTKTEVVLTIQNDATSISVLINTDYTDIK